MWTAIWGVRLIFVLTFSVCKFKAHKRCAVRATNNCKWTTLASIGKDIIEDEDGVSLCVKLFFLNLLHKAPWSKFVILGCIDKIDFTRLLSIYNSVRTLLAFFLSFVMVKIVCYRLFLIQSKKKILAKYWNNDLYCLPIRKTDLEAVIIERSVPIRNYKSRRCELFPISWTVCVFVL